VGVLTKQKGRSLTALLPIICKVQPTCQYDVLLRSDADTKTSDALKNVEYEADKVIGLSEGIFASQISEIWPTLDSMQR
jgi:hypothetical protein